MSDLPSGPTFVIPAGDRSLFRLVQDFVSSRHWLPPHESRQFSALQATSRIAGDAVRGGEIIARWDAIAFANVREISGEGVWSGR